MSPQVETLVTEEKPAEQAGNATYTDTQVADEAKAQRIAHEYYRNGRVFEGDKVYFRSGAIYHNRPDGWRLLRATPSHKK